ncbi:MAG: ATPase domain-containing protein [Promethearchaeota archaeon]
MPTETRLKSGCTLLDEAMGGGLVPGEIVQIYGPSGAGKTTLAMQYSIEAARQGFQIIYVNVGRAFSIYRFRQMASSDFDLVAPRLFITSPTKFSQQGEFFDMFETICPPNTHLLVVDTIVSLYRKELGDFSRNIMLSRLLNRQLGAIATIAKRGNITALLLNQVRGDMESLDGFHPMANSIISFWCTTTIRIKKAESMGHREFKLFTGNANAPIEFIVKLNDSGFV